MSLKRILLLLFVLMPILSNAQVVGLNKTQIVQEMGSTYESGKYNNGIHYITYNTPIPGTNRFSHSAIFAFDEEDICIMNVVMENPSMKTKWENFLNKNLNKTSASEWMSYDRTHTATLKCDNEVLTVSFYLKK